MAPLCLLDVGWAVDRLGGKKSGETHAPLLSLTEIGGCLFSNELLCVSNRITLFLRRNLIHPAQDITTFKYPPTTFFLLLQLQRYPTKILIAP